MVMDQVKMPGWAMASIRVTTVPDQHHEHDGVLDLDPGVELLDGVDQGVAQDLAVEEAAGLGHAVGAPVGLAWSRCASTGCRVSRSRCPVLVGWFIRRTSRG